MLLLYFPPSCKASAKDVFHFATAQSVWIEVLTRLKRTVEKAPKVGGHIYIFKDSKTLLEWDWRVKNMGLHVVNPNRPKQREHFAICFELSAAENKPHTQLHALT